MIAFFVWNEQHQWFRVDELTGNIDPKPETDPQILEACEDELKKSWLRHFRPGDKAQPALDGKASSTLVLVSIPGPRQPDIWGGIPSGFTIL